MPPYIRVHTSEYISGTAFTYPNSEPLSREFDTNDSLIATLFFVDTPRCAPEHNGSVIRFVADLGYFGSRTVWRGEMLRVAPDRLVHLNVKGFVANAPKSSTADR